MNRTSYRFKKEKKILKQNQQENNIYCTQYNLPNLQATHSTKCEKCPFSFECHDNLWSTKPFQISYRSLSIKRPKISLKNSFTHKTENRKIKFNVYRFVYVKFSYSIAQSKNIFMRSFHNIFALLFFRFFFCTHSSPTIKLIF